MGILDIIYFLRERKFAFADYTTKGYNSTLLYYILYFNTKKKQLWYLGIHWYSNSLAPPKISIVCMALWKSVGNSETM